LPGTQQKLDDENQGNATKRSLKSKGKVLYEYSFDGSWCKYRKMKSDGSISEWMEPESMIIEMRE